MPERNADSKIEHKLSRREFVRGATIMAGAAVLGLSPSGAHADTSEQALTLAFCCGGHLVDPSHFTCGDSSLVLSRVRVTIDSHQGKSPSLLGLSAVYRIQGEAGPIDVPYHAWTRSPYGDKPHTFTIPVNAKQGLTLTVRPAASGSSPLDETCRLVVGADTGAPKLRKGTYLLGRGVDWSRCEYRPGEDATPGSVLYGNAPDFDYLIITVSDS